ncbi:MAG: tRNA pseudouridine(55) synthase TruB [Bryobacteraceae bacterium]
MNGLVIIDKPAGRTSHDIVNAWRRLSGSRRVGHLGTLDPMATGVLALVVGSATRLAQFYGKQLKTYQAEILFGKVSDTYDVEGEVTSTGVATPDPCAVRTALNRFRGSFSQVPPPVSAKKVKGVPAYKLARKKIDVELQPVQVEISELVVNAQQSDSLTINVTCSAGTYIRGIAHDLGQQLGCGAVLAKLRRTRSGDFDLSRARSLDDLTQMAAEGRLSEAVIPASTLLPQFPAAYVDATTEAQIRQGREFRTSPFVVTPGAPFVKAVSHSGELIAIGELKFPNVYHPAIVL